MLLIGNVWSDSKKWGRLNLQYIRHFRILEKIGLAAYCLELPRDLEQIYDLFHVFMLRKYISNPSQVLETSPVEFREDLSFEVQSVRIVDQRMKVLRNKVILMVKVFGRSNRVEEMTWETKALMRSWYSFQYSDWVSTNFEDKFFLKG